MSSFVYPNVTVNYYTPGCFGTSSLKSCALAVDNPRDKNNAATVDESSTVQYNPLSLLLVFLEALECSLSLLLNNNETNKAVAI